jgi:hypothetical protein
MRNAIRSLLHQIQFLLSTQFVANINSLVNIIVQSHITQFQCNIIKMIINFLLMGEGGGIIMMRSEHGQLKIKRTEQK